MADKNMDMKKEHHQGVSPVAAAVTGAVIGAGAAVAGSIALSNEGNRQKVSTALNGMKDRAIEYLENKKSNGKTVSSQIKKNSQESKKTLGKKIGGTKRSVATYVT